MSRPVSVLSLTLLCVSGPEGALGPNMKPHSTCSKAVFATLVGCPTGRFTFPWAGAEEGGARGSVGRSRCSGSSLSSGKGQKRPQAPGVTEYRCTLGVDVQPTGLKPRSTQGIWDTLCPRTRKLQPSPFCEGSSAMKGQYIWRPLVRTHRESTASKTDTPLFISLALHPAKPSVNAGFCSYLLTYEDIGTTSNPSFCARRVNTISVTPVLIQATVRIPDCALSTSSKPERCFFASSISSCERSE